MPQVVGNTRAPWEIESSTPKSFKILHCQGFLGGRPKHAGKLILRHQSPGNQPTASGRAGKCSPQGHVPNCSVGPKQGPKAPQETKLNGKKNPKFLMVTLGSYQERNLRSRVHNDRVPKTFQPTLLSLSLKDMEYAGKCSPASTFSQAMLGFIVQGAAFEQIWKASCFMHSTIKHEIIFTLSILPLNPNWKRCGHFETETKTIKKIAQKC